MGHVWCPNNSYRRGRLRGLAEMYDLHVLVETGTNVGGALFELKGFFDKIYTIEIVPELTAKAKAYLGPQPHIEYIIGDSGIELGNIMPKIDRPTLFWLDGHHSGGDTGRCLDGKDTPVMKELPHILKAPDLGHVIVIDNAASFGKARDYPTLDELRRFVFSYRENVNITVEGDGIIIVPQRRLNDLKMLWQKWNKELANA